MIHVNGSIDPLRDIDTINTELMLADLDSLGNQIKKMEKLAKSDKSRLHEFHLAKRIYQTLEEGRPASSIEIDKNEGLLLKNFHLLTTKPVLYACNISENTEESKPFVDLIARRASEENHHFLTICSSLEAEISQFEESEKKEFLESMGMKEPGLDRLIYQSYQLLKLITYFTAGEKEVRAWTIPNGYSAPQAAGVIHSDFERGFIRAETFHCEDLFKLGSETAIKSSGRLRSEGKDYIVQDGDVMLFRFNV